MQERNGKPPEVEALLAFPTAFPIKIMGRREGGFTTAVIVIVLRHAPDFVPGTLETRPQPRG